MTPQDRCASFDGDADRIVYYYQDEGTTARCHLCPFACNLNDFELKEFAHQQSSLQINR
jgi:hypothetical protein